MQGTIRQLQDERKSLINQTIELEAKNNSIESAVMDEQKRCQEILEEERSRHQQVILQLEYQLKEQKTKAQRFYQIILNQGTDDGVINESQLAKEFREMYYGVNNLVRSYYQLPKAGRPGPTSADHDWHKDWIGSWNLDTPEMRNHFAMAGIFSILYKMIFKVMLFGAEAQMEGSLASFESHARDCQEGKVIPQFIRVDAKLNLVSTVDFLEWRKRTIAIASTLHVPDPHATEVKAVMWRRLFAVFSDQKNKDMARKDINKLCEAACQFTLKMRSSTINYRIIRPRLEDKVDPTVMDVVSVGSENTAPKSKVFMTLFGALVRGLPEGGSQVIQKAYVITH